MSGPPADGANLEPGACGACGSPLDAGARFCRRCGAMVQREAAGSHHHDPRQAPAWPVGSYPSSGLTQASTTRAPLVAGVALAALLLVAGVVVALVLAVRGGGGGIVPVTVATVTAAARPVEAPGVPNAGSSTGSGVSSADARSGSSSGSVSAFHGARVSAVVPAGWSLEEDEAQKQGYVESRWRADDASGAYLLIDESPPTHLTPEQDAAPVHSDLERASGYREISYGPGDLSAVSSWMWVFTISGDERIDYFFERCGGTFGVLGSSPQHSFARLRAAFRGFADSVRATCG